MLGRGFSRPLSIGCVFKLNPAQVVKKEIRKYKVMFLTGIPDEYEQVEDRYCLQQNNPHCHYYHRDSHHRGPRLHQVH